MAVPVNKLSPPDEMSMAMYASIAESKKMEEKSGVGRSLDVLEGLLAK